ncbi:MAG TPA: VOC family protein [Candidatus Dormibacteraeota bacterium]|nr:VOC family protein [Candidatus Dormibacteraeota bacterium]
MRPPRSLRRLGHVCLQVPDVPRAVDFYVRACNLVEVTSSPGEVLLRCDYHHHCLVLRPGPEPALAHVGFETLDDDVTERLRSELGSRGVPVREAPPEEGRLGPAFQFRDPEGNWIEVYRAMARLQGVLVNGPFRLEKLGHVTFLARDLHQQAEFYRSIGFRLSDRSPRGAFLRCGTDHHGLAFLPGKRSTLHHHAYDVGDWGQIKLVLDALCRRQVVPDVGPVRHGPGNNIAVYVRDPAGFRIEFYCEMEQIEDDEDHERTYDPPTMNLWLRQPAPPGFHD